MKLGIAYYVQIFRSSTPSWVPGSSGQIPAHWSNVFVFRGPKARQAAFDNCRRGNKGARAIAARLAKETRTVPRKPAKYRVVRVSVKVI